MLNWLLLLSLLGIVVGHEAPAFSWRRDLLAQVSIGLMMIIIVDVFLFIIISERAILGHLLLHSFYLRDSGGVGGPA